MKEKEKTNKEVELRSEEVQEVMGKIPPNVIRYGITILFGILLTLLVGSYFFKYPNVATTEMTLTGRQSVIRIVARNSGRIDELYVSEGEKVQKGSLLAVLENSASTKDIFRLKAILSRYINNPDSLCTSFITKENLSLGAVQSTYSNFLDNIYNYKNFLTHPSYPPQIEQTWKQIQLYKDYYHQQEQQMKEVKLQYKIAKQQYIRDSLLSAHNETVVFTLLQGQSSIEGLSASLASLKMQIAIHESTLLNLRLEQAEKRNVLLQSYHREAELLQNAIHDWVLSYCLVSPIKGKVTLTADKSVYQYISSGENVFAVVPEESEGLIGKAYLPVQISGKVKIGQRVIIRLKKYPDKEFGVVKGEISSISLVPIEGNYLIEIKLPDGLVTSYGIILPVSQDMTASGEIVIQESRLIERFIMPVKKLIKE